MTDQVLEEIQKIQFEAHAEGHKSSEGDGRTAADIEAESARREQENEQEGSR